MSFDGIRINGPALIVVLAATFCAGCQPATDAPSSTPANQPQPADDTDDAPASSRDRQGSGAGTGSGAGAGGGGGQGTGDGRNGDCAGTVVLTLDGAIVWRRTREELAANQLVGPIPGYRDGSILGVRLEDLLSELESMRSVRVSSCGGRSLEVKAGQLVRAPLYLQLGGSGRWRLVDLANPEVPAIFVRDVARIEASTEETPDTNPDG